MKNSIPNYDDVLALCAVALDPLTRDWAKRMGISAKLFEDSEFGDVYLAMLGGADILGDRFADFRNRQFGSAYPIGSVHEALLKFSTDAWMKDTALLEQFQRIAWNRFDSWGIDVLEWATRRVKAGDRGDTLWRASVVLSFAASNLTPNAGAWIYRDSKQEENP